MESVTCHIVNNFLDFGISETELQHVSFAILRSHKLNVAVGSPTCCVPLRFSGVSGHEHDRLLPQRGPRWHPERRQRCGHHWSCHHVLLCPLRMVSKKHNNITQ